jgi:hypothetical protein
LPAARKIQTIYGHLIQLPLLTLMTTKINYSENQKQL